MPAVRDALPALIARERDDLSTALSGRSVKCMCNPMVEFAPQPKQKPSSTGRLEHRRFAHREAGFGVGEGSKSPALILASSALAKIVSTSAAIAWLRIRCASGGFFSSI